ncbi:UNVERIFIED_CONTAM: hypothetical protein PYX00_010010 [Menopon gallinae]|uniref:Uncharacterized protein n=1 Tax=Menopon gallinae TaxID=328185 RepID=A0AAW2HDH2_9NEOP
MAVRVNSAVLEDNDRFASVSIPVSPDGEKSGSDASDASNSSPKGKSDCCDEKFPSPRNSSPRVHSASPESSRSRASTPRAQPDAPNPFDNPSESFKLTNSFLADPYFRLNPFQPFLNAPFLATDPKAFLGDAGFGLIHSKPDIPMTIQQLQFLHNKLQGLPVCPMYQRTGRKATAASPAAGGLPSASDPPKIGRRTSEDGDESDELLSVGSESPPPPPAVTPFRRDTDNESDAGSGSLDCSFGKSKKFPAQQGNSKCENNRTLKFSIDNILKSDFGNENAVASPRKTEERKEQPKKAEAPVDLSQENGTNAAGTDAPMLWPAWVYCTRYSDRPSSEA